MTGCVKAQERDDSFEESSIKADENPEDIYYSTEKREMINDALSQLTPKQKRVIELSYYYQYSHSEIAQAVDIPVGSVKSTIRVAMVKLRNILKVQGVAYEEKIH